MQLKPTESAISGAQAYEVGAVTIKREDGRTEYEKYMVILKRVGNDWKIAYDIYNSDAPPAPQKE